MDQVIFIKCMDKCGIPGCFLTTHTSRIRICIGYCCSSRKRSTVDTMALSSSSLCCYASIRDTRMPHHAKLVSSSRQFGTAFATGSPLSIRTQPIYRRKATSVSVRCEQSTNEQGSGLDVWLGRLAMVGFAAAISVEIATGKGLLQNFGLTDPLPTVALAVTALVVALTAVFIFQSASKN
ncbi:stress enhanced protein 1, chloroplastic-like [Salvia hispanica]|uniref:stress enhanced protein 1, chloroplastic-like n=1 Tax=Salvia hispanica TaxID=49212 RepID=UPI002009B60C|nr:stress enhanced protein 1, chloroplastic-like [Salvia hispanica]